MTRPLDFLVIGAPKAGTTSVFEYLRQHPGVALPPDKEAPYFCTDAEVAKGWSYFLDRYFANADPHRRWGTVTPQYMFGTLTDPSPGVAKVAEHPERTIPERIKEQLPDVRLVALLREPVARARSDHRMNAMFGNDQREFSAAIAELLRPDSLGTARRVSTSTNRYVVAGEYGRILRPYFELFSREQLLVLFTDDLDQDAASVMQRIYAHIGVDPAVKPRNLGERYNVGADARRLPLATLGHVGAYVARYGAVKSAWERLSTPTQNRILSAVDRADYRFKLWNARARARPPQPEDSATVARLHEHYSADTRLLSDLLGREPDWCPRGSA